MNIITIEREVDGTTYIIRLHRDEENPERNRFDFEGEQYSLIIRTPKPVPGPPAEPKPTIHEKIEEILCIVRELKGKAAI